MVPTPLNFRARLTNAASGFERYQLRALVPGLIACLVAAALANTVSLVLPGVSPLLVAIILGIIVANTLNAPTNWTAGIDFSAKKLLRLGIVFLGFQLLISEIVNLGWPLLIVVVGIVTVGIFGTLAMGKALNVSPHLTMLIACGFSICGAAAVAAAASVTQPASTPTGNKGSDKRASAEHDKNTVTAIALVVIFGTVMIGLVPLVAKALNLSPIQAGALAGGSIHEVAQVVATGSIVGGGALAVAVIVKLTRVLMLAPVIAILSARARKSSAQTGAKKPPLVPLFILGFLAAVAIRSTGAISPELLSAATLIQNTLLSAAMFALGCGVKARHLVAVGAKPFLLATLSTLLVAGVASIAVVLV